MDYSCVVGFIIGCAGTSVGIGTAMLIIVLFFWLVDKIFCNTSFGRELCGKKNQ